MQSKCATNHLFTIHGTLVLQLQTKYQLTPIGIVEVASVSATHTLRTDSNVLVLVLLRLLPFIPQPVVVLDKVNQLPCLVSHIDPLVLAVLIDERVILQGPQVVDVLPRGCHHPLRAIPDEIVEQQETLVRPAPVLLVVLQHPLPQHRHDLGKVLVCECGVRQLLHQWTRGTPWLVVGRLAHLRLDLRVVHDDIGAVWGEGGLLVKH